MIAAVAMLAGLLALTLSHEPAAENPQVLKRVEAQERTIIRAGMRTPNAGEISREFRDPMAGDGQGPLLVALPAGRFEMGSDREETGHDKNEYPKHPVEITTPFAIGKYEVTAAEFRAFLIDTGKDGTRECEAYEDYNWVTKTSTEYAPSSATAQMPAICVSWEEALAYTAWLAEQTGLPYRLLNEAEWEYAARAGTQTAYSFGNAYQDGCAFMNGVDQSAMDAQPELIGASCDDGFAELAPVGALQPNAFGLHDMHGNAWEWTADVWTSSHADDAWSSDARVMKGGSWFSYPLWLRSANRNSLEPDRRRMDVGFRVARDLSEAEAGER